jgi:hypothetical protein
MPKPISDWKVKTRRMSKADRSFFWISARLKPPSVNRFTNPYTVMAIRTRPNGLGPRMRARMAPMISELATMARLPR